MNKLALVLLAALCLSACASSRIADYPAPGKLVDIGTHRMHIHCTGQGSPTILLESGAATGVTTWQAIQPSLSAMARTCSYDRSGLVWSDKRDGVHSAERVAAELKRLLDASGEAGPYVLVAASLGGIYARKYTEAYPADVVGLVLVDSSHPDQMERMPEGFQGTSVPILKNAFVRSLTGGLLSITGYGEKMMRRSFVTMPKDVTDLNMVFLNHSLPTIIEEIARVPDILKEVGNEQHFGDIPVYVIANGLQYKPAYGINSRYPADKLAEAERVSRELQTGLLSLSSRSVLLVADESGHNVNFEQPEIVIDAVEMLLEDLNTGDETGRDTGIRLRPGGLRRDRP
jgi:pimeloyl-ACP methyl ester carboxylesterase